MDKVYLLFLYGENRDEDICGMLAGVFFSAEEAESEETLLKAWSEFSLHRDYDYRFHTVEEVKANEVILSYFF
jgi:hypothetical protein